MPVTMLGFFLIVVGLPVIAGAWGAHMKRKMHLHERELEVMEAQTLETAARYSAQVERLEQRVRVLERIVTDRGFSLASEIEQLRDDNLPRVDH